MDPSWRSAATIVTICSLSGVALSADMEVSGREASIAGIERALTEHTYTVTDLANYYVARIGAIDQNSPALRSIIEVNPDWRSIAQRLDREAQSNGTSKRAPLFGVPIVLKDNIDTADRMRTAAGSLALLDSSPQRDAFIVRRLREAGALILGKANLSEWAGIRSFQQTAGWTGRGGQTRNPYDPARSSAGSSSRICGRRCSESRGRRDAHRYRRIHRRSGVGQRCGRHQADGEVSFPAPGSFQSPQLATPPGLWHAPLRMLPRCSA